MTTCIYVTIACILVVTSQRAQGFRGSKRNVINIPDPASLATSSINASQLVPQVWSDDIIIEPLTDITICLWAKTSKLRRTGTLFVYSTNANNQELSLVGLNRDTVTSQVDYDVYLVVKGRRSLKSIRLRMDDVRWHYVCVTWSQNGKWEVIMDNDVIESGSDLQSSALIEPNGIFRIGTPSSTKFSQFVGKITGLTVWGRVLSSKDIKVAGNCIAFNNRQKKAKSMFDLQSSSDLAPLLAALVYDWSSATITSQWPATFYPNEDVCGGEVTVECTHNRMLISVSGEKPSTLNIKRNDLHLNEDSCRPTARGSKEDYYVFDVTDLESCGTEREVTSSEVIYRNRVSNTPTEIRVIVLGYLYSANVRCHYPIDLTVSTRFIPPDDSEAVSRTPIRNPKTNTDDMEAVVLLFRDNAYEQSRGKDPVLSPTDNLYVGLVLQETADSDKDKDATSPTNDALRDVNVVVDTCYIRSQRQRRKVIGDNGCWSASPDISVFENGQRPQARYKLPSRALSFTNGPTFLDCKVYPCVGKSCAPACGQTQSSPQTRGGSRGRSKRAATPKPDSYDISIGPLYTKGFWNDQVKTEEIPRSRSDLEIVYTNPLFLVTASGFILLAIICVVLVTIILRKNLRSAKRKYEVNAPVRITRHRRRPDPSLSSLSSGLSASHYDVNAYDVTRYDVDETHSLPSLYLGSRANSVTSLDASLGGSYLERRSSLRQSQSSLDSTRFSASWH